MKRKKNQISDIEEMLDEKENFRKKFSWPLKMATMYKRLGEKSEETNLLDYIKTLAHVRKSLPKEVKDMVEKSLPEVIEVFSSIKKIGFTGRLVDSEKKWMNSALERFDDSKKGWEYIKREFLEDKKLYWLNQTKEKRDFIGVLLKKIVEDQGLGKYGAQELYAASKKLKPTNRQFSDK